MRLRHSKLFVAFFAHFCPLLASGGLEYERPSSWADARHGLHRGKKCDEHCEGEVCAASELWNYRGLLRSCAQDAALAGKVSSPFAVHVAIQRKIRGIALPTHSTAHNHDCIWAKIFQMVPSRA